MDRYFNNGTGIPMSEDDYYEYTAENDLPEEYELSQEEKDYLVGKTDLLPEGIIDEIKKANKKITYDI